MVPAGSRYRDWFDMVNGQHGRGYRTVEINSPSISSWGRWEGLSNLWTDAELQQELVDLDIKEGAEYTYDATTTAGECRWMAEYEVGDLVTRNNIRLGLTPRTTLSGRSSSLSPISCSNWRFVGATKSQPLPTSRRRDYHFRWRHTAPSRGGCC
jgi:hypothetical protein